MTILRCDARSIPVDDNRFAAIVTSPPYWSLRSYGDDPAEIGAGDLDTYLDAMAVCAREWRRVLRDDGTLWLNLADTAAGSGGAGGDYNRGGAKDGKPRYRQGDPGRSAMQWCNIPHRVIEAFVAEGWLYRACVTWNKNRVRPENLWHVRRPGVSHEFIFMLTKSRAYGFYPDRLPELGSVWTFPPARGRNHLAPFPPELPRRCILASTMPGDEVLDPFVGSGTTVEVANELGRVGVGCDLYEW